MSNFGDPGPGHRNALDAVNEARQKALTAVSKMRQAGPPPHLPNLAPADDEEPALATIATQAVVDYLIQLRPYRSHSSTWNVSFGELRLPEQIGGEEPPGRLGKSTNPRALHICRNPSFYVENVSDFVEVANATVSYSSELRSDPGAGDWQPRNGSAFNQPWNDTNTGDVCDQWTLETEKYGTLRFTDKDRLNALLKGEISVDEAAQFAEPADQPDTDDTDEGDDLVLGDPNVRSVPGDTRGRDPEVKSFKLVFPADDLQRFLQLGDDVAAELDVLADLEAPDHAAGPGGAV